MKHINLIFLLLAVVASSALAQTVSSDTIATRLWRQVNAFRKKSCIHRPTVRSIRVATLYGCATTLSML